MTQTRGDKGATRWWWRAVFWLWAALSASAAAANWPGWRGPNGSGKAAEKNLPLHWGTNENVAWRVPLPDRGNSTPIVWRKRIFLTQAISSRSGRAVMCFDRGNGKLLWQSGVTWTEKEPSSDSNPPCTPSPVTDGQRVIAWFGSAGVYCYNFAGHELWRHDLGQQMHQWGYASSLVLYLSREHCGDRRVLRTEVGEHPLEGTPAWHGRIGRVVVLACVGRRPSLCAEPQR
jgi:outer membrane protein assembly factor BamB